MSNHKKYQIFVSSTFTDLIAERQSAVEAILKAGHIPAGMELFTSSNKSQWEVIKRWINESDIYMLILGGRYGSIEPESGKSYTQLEYEYAQEIGKPLFAVVMNNEAKKELKATQIETENPEKLEEFRKTVLDFMSAFFTDTKDIKLAIHESLNDIIRDNQLVGWVRGNSQNENIAEELALLSEENRKLREENTKLKDDETKRLPKISIFINDDEQLEFSFDTSNFNYYEKQKPIQNVPSHFLNFVNQKEIDDYNHSLEKLDSDLITNVNLFLKKLFLIKNSPQKLSLSIRNIGNIKATSIIVKVKFPNTVEIFEDDNELEKEEKFISKILEKSVPYLNRNLLDEAKEKYEKHFRESQMPLAMQIRNLTNQQDFFLSNRLEIPSSILPNFKSNNIEKVEDNELHIFIKELIHEDSTEFKDLILVPLHEGEGNIEIYIHCAEYAKSVSLTMPIIISKLNISN